MKKIIVKSIVLTLSVIILMGFMSLNPYGSKTQKTNTNHNPYRSISYHPYGTVVYTDNFDGDNTMTGLLARGYLPSNQSVPVGTTSWFQGDSSIIPQFNGPPNGYVAANYNNTGNNGNIDNWLVFPRINGGIVAGDSLFFWARSTDLATANFPDSIRVMYSANDSVPSGNWTELGRFHLVNPAPNAINNGYLLYGLNAPATSVIGRFAIRYCVADGGLNGSNSDFMAIDAANIVRTSIGITEINSNVPNEYMLNQNFPNPFNPVTKINFAIPKPGFVSLKIYDLLGKEVSTLVNQNLHSGNYSVDFNGINLSSGVYLYKIESDNFTSVKKMMLVK